MEKKYIDLHIHTTYSDGELSPEKIVEFSALNGISILAITDHDNMRGYLEALKPAKEYGIKLIPGVEITTPKYHLLALNFDPHNLKFQEFLEKSRTIQRTACSQRVEILKKEGIPISMEKIDQLYPNARLGKGNIRKALLKDPECREHLRKKHPGLAPLEIYQYYLGEGGIASNLEPRAGVSPEEAIKAVHDAGGIIGIAHPPKDIEKIEELNDLLKLGLNFLEVQPNLKTKYSYQQFEDFAKKNGLPVTYGSDYHCPTRDRPMLKRGENILSTELAKILEIER